jgi:transposase
MVQAPAPNHTIARGLAGSGLLAHIIVSKFDDHLLPYRQAALASFVLGAPDRKSHAH